MDAEKPAEKSLAFATVKGVFHGAILAGATGAVVNSLYRSKSAGSFKLPTFKGTLHEATDVFGWVLMGAVGFHSFLSARAHNRELSKSHAAKIENTSDNPESKGR